MATTIEEKHEFNISVFRLACNAVIDLHNIHINQHPRKLENLKRSAEAYIMARKIYKSLSAYCTITKSLNSFLGIHDVERFQGLFEMVRTIESGN